MNILKQLKEFLTENKWTQKYAARDKNNKPINYDSIDAVCWCLIGAIGKLSDKNELNNNILNVEKLVRNYTKYYTIGGFNDNSNYKQVYRFLKNIQDEKLNSMKIKIITKYRKDGSVFMYTPYDFPMFCALGDNLKDVLYKGDLIFREFFKRNFNETINNLEFIIIKRVYE